MPEKPTYEELELKVRQLEKEFLGHKQVEKALKSEKDKFKNLLEGLANTNIGADIVSIDYEVLQQNQTLINRFGNIVGKKCYKEYMGFDEPCSFCPMIKPLENKSLEKAELRGVDGRDYEILSAPLTNPDGTVDKAIEVVLDITERKQAEESLRESEEKYRGIFDESIAIVYLFDDKKNFLDSNQAGLDLLGYSREELLNMSIPDIDADPIVVLPAHEQILGGERIINYEHRLKRKDGKVITVLNNSRPITDNDGHVIGMQSTLINITERKQAEEALQKAHNVLEQRVEKRTVELLKTNEHLKESQQNLKIKASDLEELNAALNVLLNKRQEDKEKLEDGILSNVRTLIEPYIVKLKKSKLLQNQKTLLNILESNLTEIVSPFTRKLSSKYLNLSPTEIQVANLVKHGKTNKEIAEISGVTKRTIEFHRENIRKKLGLTSRKTNLKTYLMSLD